MPRLATPHSRSFRSSLEAYLVRAHLRLVVSIAGGFVGRGLPMEDLIAAGNLGLLRAAADFGPTRGPRFRTRATSQIRRSIKRALLGAGHPESGPACVSELLARWRRAASQLQVELGRPPTEEEVVDRVELPPRRLRDARFDAALLDNGETPEGFLSRLDDPSTVPALLGGMEERAARVLRLRFGLDGAEPLTLQQIGERLGLTGERVRQIETDALGQLAESLGLA